MNDETIERRFQRYHMDNPHVYELFLKFAKTVKQKGFVKYSSKSIMERLRWHLNFETTGDTFKLNNNYTAYYARMVIENNPEFEGFFELRERKRNDRI